MNRYDLLTSLIWLLVGVGIALWSLITLTVGSLKHPGPGFLPMLCGIFMACMAVIVFFQAGKVVKRTEKKGEKRSFLEDRSLIYIVLTVIILIAYAFLLELLGFKITTLVVLFLIFTFVANTTWLIGIIESSIATAVCYLLFGYLLKIQLPRGWFGF